MNLDEFREYFDFDNCDYFYHITGDGIADKICQDGLLVDGTNITGTNNILYTTAVPINEDMINNFNEILDDELVDNKFRPTNQCVIIGASKSLNKDIVTSTDIVSNEHKYKGVVDPSYIMGYFNSDYEFTKNEDYEYGTDEFYESDYIM